MTLTGSGLKIDLRRFEQLSKSEVETWREWVREIPFLQRSFLGPVYCAQVAKLNPKVRVIVIRDGQGLLALIPIQKCESWMGHLGIYEPVGGVMTDYFGAIGLPQALPNIRLILARAKVGAVLFSHLDESQMCFGLQGDAERIGLRTRISGEGLQHWDELRGKDKKLVNDTERRERKLGAEHGMVSFEFESSNPRIDMADLIELKQRQYDRTGKSEAPLFDPRNVALLNSMLLSKDQECGGVLSVLRVNGKLVAAHFGLRCYNVLHFWFPVYAPEFAAYSPGRILYRYALQAGSLAGIRVLDRGEGDTPAKRDFANDSHLFFNGVWWPKNLRGLVARLGLALAWRLSSK